MLLTLLSLIVVIGIFRNKEGAEQAVQRRKDVRSWQTGLSHVKNHPFWSASTTFSGDGRVIWAKFQTFMSHIINRHLSLDEALFNKCSHGEIHPRRWLQAGMLPLRNSPLKEKQSALVHVFHIT